jgi:hypothetical protein
LTEAAREAIIRFLRDRAFGGARRSAEMVASELSGGGQLRVRGVHERDDSPLGRRELEISVEVTKVFRVRMSERQLMEEFLSKFDEEK